ncbi:methyltransferase family protein [Hyaloscypha variabilis F]|uniref:Methyltransferase family protein n=1 Tax=Hyaloscypha variabilis (strain UAMH 11265 / GT02V1 / F) TaxID=1149755 RepID=A0A2J6R1Y5_HYAVF|nr:methyltransferase family protein [Hyaloscypha variabilis F]
MPHPRPQFDTDVAGQENEETDSAFGGSIRGSETSTLDSDILRYRVENGRTYHSYAIIFWTLVLEGDLYSAPIKNPQDVLDVETGTGIWAIDVADMIPSAIVKGIDLSPIQPSWIPPNVRFEVDDYNKEREHTNRFDLIHSREILGTVPDWVQFYKKALDSRFSALRPGGWMDSTEPLIHINSIHGPVAKDHPFNIWTTQFATISEQTGLLWDVAPHLKRWMEEAGFVNVTEKVVRVAIGKWPKAQKQKELGAWNQLRLDMGFGDFTERRMRNVLNWQNDEIMILVAKIRASVQNSKEGLFMHLYHVYGQKPGE